jgi:hypothetical protein
MHSNKEVQDSGSHISHPLDYDASVQTCPLLPWRADGNANRQLSRFRADGATISYMLRPVLFCHALFAACMDACLGVESSLLAFLDRLSPFRSLRPTTRTVR